MILVRERFRHARIVPLLALLVIIGLIVGCRPGSRQPGVKKQSKSKSFIKALPIPALLEDTNKKPGVADFEITARKSSKNFLKGKRTPTLGYNGNFLGPTIRVERGEKVNMRVNNALDQVTTVHWHGLHVSGEDDGGPHQVVQPGETWKPSFTIDQEAATLWYHPHPKGITGAQVYKGLAGFLLIDDEVSRGLDVPKDYGRNDIPLVIQDKTFKSNGELEYETSIIFSKNGMFGNQILVNGEISPFLNVGTRKVRFRVLNGSNTRVYRLSLSDGRPFLQIASDGGFLNRPVRLSSLELSPSERAEIIIDFSKDSVGDSVKLVDENFEIMKFNVDKQVMDKTRINRRLGNVRRIPASRASRTRKFVFKSAGGGVSERDLTINGKLFDKDRIDEVVKSGDTEIWEIRNPSNPGENLSQHPMHIHGVHFQILSRNGRLPAENERGWKDTLLLHKDETAKLIMTFEKYTGVYMYHCHMLEHEDAGMMGQFEAK